MTPLRQKMVNDMTVRGLAENTKRSYLSSVSGLALHYHRSPAEISAQEVQSYLLFLHDERGLSWKSCNCIRHGILFLYRITLGRPDPHFHVPGTKTPSKLPEILNHDELVRLFNVTVNRKHRALLMTAYAAGLRASELGRLKISDIDSQRMLLRIEQGKGNKDRYVPLSPRLLTELREYWRRVRPEHWLFPAWSLRSPDDAPRRSAHLRPSQGEGRDRQARRDPYVASLLRHRPAPGGGRTARHPASSRPWLDPLDHALPAPGPRHHEHDRVALGPAGVPASRLS